MVKGNINNLGDLKKYPEVILEALELLKKEDWNTKENGRYEIKGKDIFVIISEYETEQESNKKPEVHREYIDIQYIFEGVEAIKLSTDLGCSSIAIEYNEENDILFYENIEDESTLIMKKGDFAIFYPEDIHKPGCTYIEKSNIKKAVVKIRKNII